MASKPKPDWLSSGHLLLGISRRSFRRSSGATCGPLAFFAIDVLVALATLIVIIATGTITWIVASKLEVARIASREVLGTAAIVIAGALLGGSDSFNQTQITSSA